MRFVFVFGVGRSGTTLLGRMMASTATPARFVTELCPGIRDRIASPLFVVEPEDAEGLSRVRGALAELASGKNPFPPDQGWRLERDDPDAQVLIVKDVHSLLAWPAIVEGLSDWRAVVITRSTPRVLDSYLCGSIPWRYLITEYGYLARQLDVPGGDARVARVAAELPPAAADYLRRPRLLTRGWLRQAVATEFLARFLRRWADEDARVTHVDFESLCRDPLGEATRLLELLDLDCDDGTLESIRRTTSGSSQGYYATDKDSRRVLEQPYRVLGARQRRRLARLLGGGPPC
jgi:hypothetical protein